MRGALSRSEFNNLLYDYEKEISGEKTTEEDMEVDDVSNEGEDRDE